MRDWRTGTPVRDRPVAGVSAVASWARGVNGTARTPILSLCGQIDLHAPAFSGTDANGTGAHRTTLVAMCREPVSGTAPRKAGDCLVAVRKWSRARVVRGRHEGRRAGHRPTAQTGERGDAVPIAGLARFSSEPRASAAVPMCCQGCAARVAENGQHRLRAGRIAGIRDGAGFRAARVDTPRGCSCPPSWAVSWPVPGAWQGVAGHGKIRSNCAMTYRSSTIPPGRCRGRIAWHQAEPACLQSHGTAGAGGVCASRESQEGREGSMGRESKWAGTGKR